MVAELELAEAAALADACRAAPDTFRLLEPDGAVCACLPALSGVPDVNRVIGATATTDLAAVRAFYGDVVHLVHETPGADGLAERLREQGYTPAYAWMKFARPADPGADAPTGLRIAEVSPERAQDFAVPVAGGFGMPDFMRDALAVLVGRPGWTCLAGYDADGRPVSGGALFVTGREAWVGMGATLPDARGQGGQGALLAARIRLAAQQGATRVTTETGVREPGRPERSYRNILRAGFAECYVRPNWRSGPASAG